eukprot:Pgem_evm1s11653
MPRSIKHKDNLDQRYFFNCPCPDCNFKEQKDDRTLLRHAITSYYGPDRDKILIDKAAPDQDKERRRVLKYVKEHLRTVNFKKAREQGLVAGSYWLPDYDSLVKFSKKTGFGYNYMLYHNSMVKDYGNIQQAQIQNSVNTLENLDNNNVTNNKRAHVTSTRDDMQWFKDNYPKAPRLKLDFNADPAPNIDIDIEMEQDETCT